jgi:DnaK suppressor protein
MKAIKMDKADLRRYQRRLESCRGEAFRSLDRAGEETRALDIVFSRDSADQSIASLSRESLFEQSSQRRGLIRMIEAALQRIREGTYGVCVACGDDIQSGRLEALPWTQHCSRCNDGGSSGVVSQASWPAGLLHSFASSCPASYLSQPLLSRSAIPPTLDWGLTRNGSRSTASGWTENSEQPFCRAFWHSQA